MNEPTKKVVFPTTPNEVIKKALLLTEFLIKSDIPLDASNDKLCMWMHDKDSNTDKLIDITEVFRNELIQYRLKQLLSNN